MATRQAEKEARRAEREAREREAAAREQRRKRVRLALAGAVALAVVAVAAVLALGATGGGDSGSASVPDTSDVSIPAVKTRDLDAAVRAAGGRINRFDYGQGQNDHTTSPTETVTYPMNPPTNGRHYQVPASDGSYVGRETPTKEAVVHSLEHGRIVIQYRPGLPATQIAQLEKLFEEDPQRVLLIENNTGMREEVAATAWARSLTFPRFNAGVFDAIRAFIVARRDQGPEKILQPQ